MNEKTVQKKSLLAIILALVMTTSMFPLVVLADTALTISSPRTANTTLYTGDSFTLSVSNPDFSNSTTNHIDWASSDTSVATIGKHNGNVSIINAGSVTFTATVMDGAKPSGNGTGGGNGSSCTASTGYETATISFTVAQSSTYGYQGTGGNTMLLTALDYTAISSIIAGIEYDIDGTTITGYNNTINSPTAEAGQIWFSFTMSAGVNNFQPDNFNTNCVGQISIQQYSSGNWTSFCGINSVSSSNFDQTTHIISIQASSSLSEGKYKIVFGPNVCGNNSNKKLGVPVSFIFDVVSD